MRFHILSFEGPDPYSRAGGLATRVDGLAATLAALGFETHLWFVGAPDLPGHEVRAELHLHRWAQWISQHHADYLLAALEIDSISVNPDALPRVASAIAEPAPTNAIR